MKKVLEPQALGFSLPNNLKYLDLSFKTDLDFWIVLEDRSRCLNKIILPIS